jgi:hypothetical protein
MNRWLLGMLVATLAATVSLDAAAQRRLGGGRSLGRQSAPVQRQVAPNTAPATPATPTTPSTAAPGAAPAAAAAPAASATAANRGPLANPAAPLARPASPWRNMLLGAAAGLGLMALAHALGFGEGLATLMMFALGALVVSMLVGLLLRRMRGARATPVAVGGKAATIRGYGINGYGIGGPSYGPAQAPGTLDTGARPALPQRAAAVDHAAATAEVESNTWLPASTGSSRPGSAMDEFMGSGRPAAGAAVPSNSSWAVPADFDRATFLAQAKAHFTRLQAAWDGANLDTLADFTTQDMFTALTHELRARGTLNSRSEATSLDAELLGVETDATVYTASVRFTGALRVDGELEPLDEVWNLTKPRDGSSGWLLAGIQQLA